MSLTKRGLTHALTFELAATSPNAPISIVDQSGNTYDLVEVFSSDSRSLTLRVQAYTDVPTDTTEEEDTDIYEGYHFEGVCGD